MPRVKTYSIASWANCETTSGVAEFRSGPLHTVAAMCPHW